jgi:spermidine synthase
MLFRLNAVLLLAANALSARIEKAKSPNEDGENVRGEFLKTSAKVQLHETHTDEEEKNIASDSASLICADNDSDGVQVWLRSDNSRSMTFGGDTLGSQTSVFCKGSVPSSCQASTPPSSCAQVQCACDPDTSQLEFPYMRAIAKEVVSDGTCTGSSQSRLLLIGLGGGALAMYLQSHCPNLEIDAVEANKHVVDVAYHLFGLDSSGSKVSVERADGGVAVQSRVASGAQYDFIVVDCFQAQGQVPESCRSEAFISGLRSLLNPRGKALQQVWQGQYNSILYKFQNEFGIAHAFGETVDGIGVNRMIVAGGKDAVLEQHNVKEASAENAADVTSYFKAAAMPKESTQSNQNATFAEAKMAGKWDTIRQEEKESKEASSQAEYTDADEAAMEAKDEEEEASGEVPRWDALGHGGQGSEWQRILKPPVDMNAHVDIKDVMG